MSTRPVVILVRTSLSLACVLLTLTACDDHADPAPAEPATAHRHAEPDPHEAEPAAPNYTLRFELPEDARAGQEALAKVHVSPRDPWHLNTDFPASLELEAPEGVALVQAEQRKEDAEQLDETGLVFSVPFTPADHGAKRFMGTLKFAMCAEQACDPTSVPLDFAIDVCRQDAVSC